ncbi:MAG: hypothetical protein ACOYYS_27975 [Chloroflexota bacterium]
MADVRCPMCSKPNPAGVQACQHCGARLKPLVAPSQPDSPSPTGTPPSGAQDASDWLGDLRSGGADTFGADAGESFDDGDGDSDWFSRLGQDDDTPASAAAFAKPDWLAAPTEKGDPNIPDWMEELGVSADTGQSEASAGQFFRQEEESAEEGAAADDLKDWLAGLSDSEAASSPLAESASDEALPDWLSGFDTDADSPQSFAAQPPADEASAMAEPLPDWLSAAADEPAAPTMFTGEPDSGAETAEVPDWLTAPGGLPEPAAPAEMPSTSESGLPDWLSGIESPDLAEAPQDAGQSESAETLPAWLHEETEEQALPVDFGSFETPESETVDAEAQQAPDWLSQFGEAAALDEGPAPDAESQGVVSPKPFPTGSLAADDFLSDNTPDWLSNLGGLDEIVPEESAAAAPLGGGTDWLSGLGSLGDDEASSEERAPDASQAPDGAPALDKPSWGEMLQEEGGAQGAFEMTDLDATPDWLSSVTASEGTTEEPLADGMAPAGGPIEPGADATPAELPTWLEAMRPVESAAPSAAFRDETDTRVESAGPLSGLRGVLQAEPEVANFRKPPVYTNKLQMTETHQARIALLEELVASEGKPKPVQAFVPIRSQIALRLLIALGLVAAVLFGLWGGSQMVPLPAGELPQEIKNLRGSIEALPPNAPVLVAIDYDAGTSAEMGYPARMVLQNLAQREAFVTFVSTSLSGPLLTELLLDQVNDSLPVTYTNYTVLGYIPGGASGLLSFARSPRQLVTGLDGDGWQSPPISQIDALSEFSLVVVMTDNADTARIWIEQVHPLLDADTPLTMALSAQAEPMVRPYFLAGAGQDGEVQLFGYVAGIAGAAAYQGKLVPGSVLKEWDALTLASGVALIAIVLGGLVNFGLAVSSRPKGKK